MASTAIACSKDPVKFDLISKKYFTIKDRNGFVDE
jgi:hypothetical protein